jgi:hypothetical protein
MAEDLIAPAPLAAIVVAIAVADGRPRVTAVVDVLHPAIAAVAIRHRAVEPRTVAVHHTVAVGRRMVAAVAADMGGNTTLHSFPA